MTVDLSTPTTEAHGLSRTHKGLLACGVVYAISYVVANDLVAGLLYDGYNPLDQAISELSAKGASTRTFLVAMLPIWTVLLIAFGSGVRMSARGSRSLRMTGSLLIAQGFVGVLWLWFPMSARADLVSGTTTVNDTGHLVLGGVSVILFLAQIGFCAAAFGLRFQAYSLTTAVTSLVFGGLTSVQAAHLPDGDPTPLMGLYERVNIGAWLLWMTVLAVILLRDTARARQLGRPLHRR